MNAVLVSTVISSRSWGLKSRVRGGSRAVRGDVLGREGKGTIGTAVCSFDGSDRVRGQRTPSLVSQRRRFVELGSLLLGLGGGPRRLGEFFFFFDFLRRCRNGCAFGEREPDWGECKVRSLGGVGAMDGGVIGG